MGSPQMAPGGPLTPWPPSRTRHRLPQRVHVARSRGQCQATQEGGWSWTESAWSRLLGWKNWSQRSGVPSPSVPSQASGPTSQGSQAQEIPQRRGRSAQPGGQGPSSWPGRWGSWLSPTFARPFQVPSFGGELGRAAQVVTLPIWRTLHSTYPLLRPLCLLRDPTWDPTCSHAGTVLGGLGDQTGQATSPPWPMLPSSPHVAGRLGLGVPQRVPERWAHVQQWEEALEVLAGRDGVGTAGGGQAESPGHGQPPALSPELVLCGQRSPTL